VDGVREMGQNGLLAGTLRDGLADLLLDLF